MEARGKHSINLGSLLTPVRHDRDDFIRVNEENIAPDMRNNFEKRPYGDAGFHTAGSVDPKHTPYDVLSVIVRKESSLLWQRIQKFPNCFRTYDKILREGLL